MLGGVIKNCEISINWIGCDEGRETNGNMDSFALLSIVLSKIQILFIKMPQNPNPAPSPTQSLTFALSASISLLMLVRNSLRMRRYISSFRELSLCMNKFRNNISDLQRIREQNTKEKALLQAVFPQFPIGYFNNITNPTLYSSKVAKFYEGLQCSQGFEGVVRHRGKEYPIAFEMNRPSVGFELAENALKFDAQGIRFHRNQMIAVYGGLSYSREMKRYVMKTELIGLDTIEIMKFFQRKLIATIISTFYFSVILGVALSMAMEMDVYNSLRRRIQPLLQD